jgi:hypothetical protein
MVDDEFATITIDGRKLSHQTRKNKKILILIIATI